MTKCKFKDKCPWYSEIDQICSKDGGMYYEGRPAGCWRRLEKAIKEGRLDEEVRKMLGDKF